MRRIGTMLVMAGLLSLGVWSCGGKKTTGPETPGISEADYAVFGMMMAGGEEMAGFGGNCIVTVTVLKGGGTEDVSNWPYLKASEVKLIGLKEIALTELTIGSLAARRAGPFSKTITGAQGITPGNGGMAIYTLPEGETVAPGEAYKLQLKVEGKTFTSKSAAPVLAPLTITTPDEQQIEAGTPFTVQWQAVQHADAYTVNLSFPDTMADTTFIMGTATQKILPGELLTEEGEYYIVVMAYAGTIAQYVDQFIKEQSFAVYDFDNPKVLGTFFSMTGDDISLSVGTCEGPEQPTQMEITVSAGRTPTISWTGGNAQMLSVTLASDPSNIMWAISATNPSAGFASPVTYGQPPTGAFQVVGPKALVAGTTYQVSIVGINAQAFGTKTFTP